MTVDSLLAQLDATGRTITSIVLALVGVAAALALLTAWYWRRTDPHQRVDAPPNPPARRLRAPNPGPSDGPRPGGTTEPGGTEDPTRVRDRTAPHDGEDGGSAGSTTAGHEGDEVRSTPEAPVDVDAVIDLRDTSPDDDEGELSFDEWLELAEDDS